MRREFKIGIFAAGTLLVLALFIFFVGDLSDLFRKEGYPLYANFESVAGLEKSAVIRIAGVRAGFVKDTWACSGKNTLKSDRVRRWISTNQGRQWMLSLQ